MSGSSHVRGPMRRFPALSICLVLAASAARAQPPPLPAPAADAPAERALAEIEGRLRGGRIGWWKDRGDPALAVVGTYTGLQSDVVTVLGLGSPGDVWPLWGEVSEGLDRFGVFFSVYSVAAGAAQGQGDRAALTALKDFAKHRLSRLAEAGAVYAAGIGILDFALSSFGEAAMQSNSEKFWTAYCAYQVMRHPRRTDYLDLFRKGGFDVVAKELDAYWDSGRSDFDFDWDPNHLGGYGALQSYDPEYKEHFRARYIREDVMPVFAAWALHESTKAREAAAERVRRLLDQVTQTAVRVEVPVVETGLGAAPGGYVAELADSGGKILCASAPLGEKGFAADIPLRDLLANGRFRSSLTLVLKNAADAKAPPVRSTINLNAPATQVKRSTRAGAIVYAFRRPVFVTTPCAVQVAVTGPAAKQVRALKLRPVLPPADRGAGLALNPTSNYRSVSIENGAGRETVPAGRYLLQWSGRACQGPFTVAGPCALAFTADDLAPSDAADPPPPDTAALSSVLTAVAGKMRARSAWREQLVDEAREACASYWTTTTARVDAFWRAADACGAKADADVRPIDEEIRKLQAAPNAADPERRDLIARRQAERDTIRRASKAKIDDLHKRRETAEREIETQLAAARKAIEEAERQNQDRRRGLDEDLRKARQALEDLLGKIQPGADEAAGAFDRIAGPVRGGAPGYWPASQIDAEAAKVRQSLAALEAILPSLRQNRAALDGAIAAWQTAFGAAAETYAYAGDDLREEPNLVERAETAAGRADALLASDLIELGRAFVAKCERMVEHRRNRARRTAGLLKAVEDATAQIPAVDSAAWSAAVEGFRRRAAERFAALDPPDGPDDDPAWRRLVVDMEAWARQERDRIGDLLEGPERSETAFSRLEHAYEDLMQGAGPTDVPPEWWASAGNAAVPKLLAREAAARPFLDLRADLQRGTALGGTRSVRGAALRAIRETIDRLLGDPAATNVEQKVDALQKAGRELERLPRPLAGDRTVRWDRMRAELVRSGALEAAARARGTPLVVFKTADGRAYDKGYFWPETLPAGEAAQPTTDLEVSVEGLPEGTACLVRTSFDGGRTWMPAPRVQGAYHIAVPRSAAGMPANRFVLQVDLPDRRRLPEWEFLPLIRCP